MVHQSIHRVSFSAFILIDRHPVIAVRFPTVCSESEWSCTDRSRTPNKRVSDPTREKPAFHPSSSVRVCITNPSICFTGDLSLAVYIYIYIYIYIYTDHWTCFHVMRIFAFDKGKQCPVSTSCDINWHPEALSFDIRIVIIVTLFHISKQTYWHVWISEVSVS